MRKIYLSLFMMFLSLGLTAMPVAAFFTAQATVTNNTFSTGNLGLHLFYDCDGQEETFPQDVNSAIVDCTVDGQAERGALKYEVADGADYDALGAGTIANLDDPFTPANGWWDGLSSAIDHTFIFPGWEASTPPHQNSDLLSVGNSGDLPLALSLNLNFENNGANEDVEPLDGLAEPNGGDRIDPWNDADWGTEEGRTYYKNLAREINLDVERVDHTGAHLASANGTLFDLINGSAIDLGELAPNEVAYVRFNWDMNEDAGDAYQNRIFDYSVIFDAAQVLPGAAVIN